jgi:tetratricopeptide (TPR) repeat protein
MFQLKKMTDINPTYSKSFKENIDVLLDELKLAIQWDRPSILLTVHTSKYSQNKAQRVLAEGLQKIGQTAINIVVNKEAADIPLQVMEKQGNKNRMVFFISNIDWGGGDDGKNAYNALNLYREFFVEQRIRLVLWLTQKEELNLPRYAPDFWAFRHRVIEFASTHQPQNIKPCVGILVWHIQQSGDSADSLKEKIVFREKLLRQLPTSPESRSTRLELLYTLGFLYWSIGEPTKSTKALSAGLEILGQDKLSDIKSWLLNGLSILDYDHGDYQQAHEISSGLVQGISGDPILWMNLSVILCGLGKNHEAIIQSKKSIKLAPTNPRLWNSLGYLCISMEKLDEAAVCFKKAIELAPSNPTFGESLAICYGKMGLLEESLDQLASVQNVNAIHYFFAGVYEKALLGKTDEALSLLRAAVRSGQIPKVDIHRDPNLNVLLDPSIIQANF